MRAWGTRTTARTSVHCWSSSPCCRATSPAHRVRSSWATTQMRTRCGGWCGGSAQERLRRELLCSWQLRFRGKFWCSKWPSLRWWLAMCPTRWRRGMGHLVKVHEVLQVFMNCWRNCKCFLKLGSSKISPPGKHFDKSWHRKRLAYGPMVRWVPISRMPTLLPSLAISSQIFAGNGSHQLQVARAFGATAAGVAPTEGLGEGLGRLLPLHRCGSAGLWLHSWVDRQLREESRGQGPQIWWTRWIW